MGGRGERLESPRYFCIFPSTLFLKCDENEPLWQRYDVIRNVKPSDFLTSQNYMVKINILEGLKMSDAFKLDLAQNI